MSQLVHFEKRVPQAHHGSDTFRSGHGNDEVLSGLIDVGQQALIGSTLHLSPAGDGHPGTLHAPVRWQCV